MDIKTLIKKSGLVPPVLFCGKVVYFVVSLIETPIFLFINRREIFRNKYIYVFWEWSLGHAVVGIDFASRLYFPMRLSLLYLKHRKSNHYICECFQHNIDYITFDSYILPVSFRFDNARYSVVRFYLLMLSSITSKIAVLERSNIYGVLSLATAPLKIGREELNKLGTVAAEGDLTGYIRLLRDGVGHTPVLPDFLKEKCENEIKKRYPEFYSRPFITILLREKGSGGEFSDAVRISGPQVTYKKTVERAIQLGFNVVGTGETQHSLFSSLDGYFDLKDVRLDEKLLNLYLLASCRLFMGQQSGPLMVPTIFGINCLITNSVPYSAGVFSDNDIILYKKFRYEGSSEFLSMAEIYRDHPDLAFGYGFKQKAVEIVHNDQDEICEALEEAIDIVTGKLHLTEEHSFLLEKLHSLVNESMRAKYEKIRPPLFVLRGMANHLR